MTDGVLELASVEQEPADGQPLESSRREELLELIAAYCLDHGVSDLTLRSVSRAVGSNNRMLLYYFGSREQMVNEALRHAIANHSGIRDAFDSLRAEHDDPAVVARPDVDVIVRRLDHAWELLIDRSNLTANRLFLETVLFALRSGGALDAMLHAVNREIPAIVAGMLERHGGDPVEAASCGQEITAEWRGLQLAHLAGNTSVGPRVLHRAVAERTLRIG